MAQSAETEFTLSPDVVRQIVIHEAQEMGDILLREDSLVGGIMGKVTRRAGSRGISAEVAKGAISLEMEIGVVYNINLPIPDLADKFRRRVITAVEEITGHTVSNVDIMVSYIDTGRDE